ncbi:TetR/AcrR family transcriptional regulator [Actinomadura vinacea]|uniref:TetR/AcrR family transcriptional regulator n=1 Tax=Actinomadura vinacea TaxID=115336 RepID=A0ABP5VHA7_9ACTN
MAEGSAGGGDTGATGPAPRDLSAEDLTARARIRDAALDLFAEHGVRGTTIRGVAAAAGVSPGLVQHHFGSKEGLRKACDEHAWDILRTNKFKALEGGMDDPQFMATAMATSLRMQRYMARALVDGSPGAAALFDEAVTMTEAILQEPWPGMNKPNTSDVHAYAATVVALVSGVMVLHEHLSRVLGANTLTVEGYPRMAKAMVEILADDLLTPELIEGTLAALRKAADRADTGGDGGA